MAHNDKSARPLSPHIGIYRWQITSVLSILHRLTGVGMALAALMIMWWFVAAAVSQPYFAFVNCVLTSWAGLGVLIGSLAAFWFHFFNGLRHLRWDTGAGLGLAQSTRSGWAVLGLCVLATALSLILAL